MGCVCVEGVGWIPTGFMGNAMNKEEVFSQGTNSLVLTFMQGCFIFLVEVWMLTFLLVWQRVLTGKSAKCSCR